MQLLVETAVAHQALVARSAEDTLNLYLNLRFGQPGLQQARHRAGRLIHLGGGHPHVGDVLRTLARAHRGDRGGCVLDAIPVQPADVPEIRGGAQNIQLKSDSRAGLQPDIGQRRRKPRERPQRLDPSQRRLGPRPLQRAPHEQPRLPLVGTIRWACWLVPVK